MLFSRFCKIKICKHLFSSDRAVYWKSLVEIPQPLSLESLKLRSAKKTKVNLVDLGQCTLKSHKTVVCCDDRYNKQYLTLRNFKNNTPPLMNEILVVENFLVVVQIVVHPQNKLVFQVLDTTTNSFQLGASKLQFCLRNKILKLT